MAPRKAKVKQAAAGKRKQRDDFFEEEDGGDEFFVQSGDEAGGSESDEEAAEEQETAEEKRLRLGGGSGRATGRAGALGSASAHMPRGIAAAAAAACGCCLHWARWICLPAACIGHGWRPCFHSRGQMSTICNCR